MRDGGCARNGWCIWELPGLFIETECHGVWVDPAGQSLDITPKENNAQEILFLPDPSVVFDEKSLVRRDNIRMAIKDHPIVHSFLKSSVDYVKYLESCTDPANPRLMRVDPHVQAELLLRKARLQLEMQKLPVGRNDTCRCGSGQKYKKCCGR